MARGYGGGGRRQSYDNSMSGVLFKNKRKRNDKDPSWQGQGETDDGRGFWISAWVNEDQDGNKRINMKFEYKEERSPQQRNAARGQRRNEEFDDHDRGRGQRRAGPPPPDDDMDDDIPF